MPITSLPTELPESNRTTPAATTTLPPSAAARRANRRSDVAEGVISTAIAVLVIAFLGLLMWVGFRVMFYSATAKANQTIEQIGN